MAPKTGIPPKTGPLEDRVSAPASQFDFERLAAIYNQARVDYIVPMPMNAKRMAEYVRSYDIDLEASVVSLNAHGQETGVGMLGLRHDEDGLKRGWITRLGVIPERRGHKVGQFLMDALLTQARDRGCALIQLEVIVGNAPAYQLFRKLGFEDTRELLVIRRPPGAPEPNAEFDAAIVQTLAEDEVIACLRARGPGASWVEETRSLVNAGNLRGLSLTLPSGEQGWVVFQRTAFQLTHFVLSPGVSLDVSAALLYRIHQEFPMQDTKVENIPLTDSLWAVYQRMGYLEAFRRTEMVLRW